MQSIYDIAEICARKGVKQAVLSPGSRCAPLSIAFCKHTAIQEWTISDERSAAFIALGMIQESSAPVVLVCTSGTAVLNYAPAIAEAFYQKKPLIVITADRPPEWVDQMDGQTIRQNNVHQNHTLASFNLPSDHDHPESKWFIERSVNEALNVAIHQKGPVHINVPLREPFYPDGKVSFSNDVKIIDYYATKVSLESENIVELQNKIDALSRIVLVPGQSDAVDVDFDTLPIPVLADAISNCKGNCVVYNHDDFITSLAQEYQPELVITYGNSIISKSLKLYLRNNKVEHWHISNSEIVAADVYQSLTKIIPCTISYFIETFSFNNIQLYKDYLIDVSLNNVVKKEEFLAELPFCEFKAYQSIFKQLPDNSVLHLANSMAVRYFNYFPCSKLKELKVLSNRGTSGIDGSTSTAVGYSLLSEKLNILISGDVAFFYDRNAFWNNYLPPNFRVVLLNNKGGGIFRMIPGPVKQDELEDYFVTKQNSSAIHLAQEFGIEYFKCENEDELSDCLNLFFEPSSKPKLIEIFTDGNINTESFKKYKSYGI